MPNRSAVSAVLTQNESVLPLLNGDEDLPALRKKFPQILALEKTHDRALDAARGERRAWYYQHARLNTLGEITAGIVHEINQPLTAAQTWIQGAQRQLAQENPQAVAHALDAARVQTQRIGELLARFREHVVQEKVTLSETDLAQCWQHVGNLLEQVLHNLLSNAIQAQQENARGWVHITSQRNGDIIETLARAFEESQRRTAHWQEVKRVKALFAKLGVSSLVQAMREYDKLQSV